jgi:cytoskeletal protein CcmA (bactofilin family)
MFTKEKTSATSEKPYSNSATLISTGTVLQGDVKSENDLRIDGTIQGNVTSSAKIIIGPSGFVEGNVYGVQADVSGRVVGNITVKEILQLRAQSNVKGNIQAVKLQIDPAAVFNGQCQMGSTGATSSSSNVVSMKEIDVQTKAL